MSIVLVSVSKILSLHERSFGKQTDVGKGRSKSNADVKNNNYERVKKMRDSFSRSWKVFINGERKIYCYLQRGCDFPPQPSKER